MKIRFHTLCKHCENLELKPDPDNPSVIIEATQEQQQHDDHGELIVGCREDAPSTMNEHNSSIKRTGS